MCGIFGAIGNNNEQANIAGLTSFAYRGPDHTGYSTEAGVFLGNNRLSVIDIDTRSNQPIRSGHTGNRIVFNGEIYNYKKLREELTTAGCEFQTASDTEVILLGYETFGIAFFGKLQGMFAFAIHDVAKNKLVIARDSAGIKPLLYTTVNDSLVFASELKGITTALSDYRFTIDTEAIKLLFGYGVIPSPLTTYTEVKKLNAGSVLVYDVRTHTIEAETTIQIPKTESLSVGDLGERITASVLSQLVSDVPVGLFFSGGIDSSLIAGILHKHSVNMKAFCLQIDQKKGDIEYATKIANHLGLDVTYVPFGVTEFEAAFKEASSLIDEPTLDSSQVALYELAKTARKSVTVVLSGEGADELFHGYKRQLVIARMRPLVRADKVVDYLYTYTPEFRGRPRVFDFLYRHFASKESYYLFATAPRQIPKHWHVWRDWIKAKKINASNLDQDIYLENDLLRKIDFGTSYASIEGRVPFLDQTLWQQVIWHQAESARTGDSKVSLKELLSKYIPKEFIYRPKSGMGLPMVKIFSTSPFMQALYTEAVEFFEHSAQFADFKEEITTANRVHEPYFCYMLVTLYLSLKNTNFHD